MDKVTLKKKQIIQQITQYMIENGMSNIGLRKLAEITETSDRMLIYYFETKDALISHALHSIASNLALQLDVVLGQERRTSEALLKELLSLSHNPQFYSVIQLWFEVIGLAARGQQPYAENATAIARNWLAWIENRLREDQTAQATALFAELEGKLLLKIVRID